MSSYVDIDWEKAKNADEPELYYKVDGKIKLYKPSLANLIKKRTGQKFELMDKQIFIQESGDEEIYRRRQIT